LSSSQWTSLFIFSSCFVWDALNFCLATLQACWCAQSFCRSAGQLVDPRGSMLWTCLCQQIVAWNALHHWCKLSICRCPSPFSIVLMAAVQNTAQELVCLLLQVPLPWEPHRCASLCQLLNRSSRLQSQLLELMQQVLKCSWLDSNVALTTNCVCSDDLT